MLFHVKRFTLFFIASIFSIKNMAQGSISLPDKEFIYKVSLDTSLQDVLNADKNYISLPESEKESIYWVNYVRKQPSKFKQDIIDPFLKQFPEAKSQYSSSLISDLTHAPSSPILTIDSKLMRVAKSHAQDLGSSGHSISHKSTSGKSFQERMNEVGLYQCVAENIYEGKRTALMAIIFLLIDTNVKNLGHRKNILDPSMKYIGASFYPIEGRDKQFFLVQDFSCSFEK